MPRTTTGSGLRVSKRELFQEIGYTPHSGQVLVHRSQAPRRVLACGVRWGKSTALAMECVAALLAPAESSLGWIVSPTFDITDLVFQRVRDVIEQHFEHRIVELVPRERRILLRNLGGGVSEVRGKSADSTSSLLGAGLDWLVVDEAARLHDEVWEGFLCQRLVDRQGWALVASTPRGTQSWFYREWKLGQKGRDLVLRILEGPLDRQPCSERSGHPTPAQPPAARPVSAGVRGALPRNRERTMRRVLEPEWEWGGHDHPGGRRAA